MSSSLPLPLYTRSLAVLAIQIVLISTLFSVYNVKFPTKPIIKWLTQKLLKIEYVRTVSNYFKNNFGQFNLDEQHLENHHKIINKKVILTSDQLALFDGSRTSKPVYLALLGQIYNVNKRRKHYAPGGGYSVFAGRDATRAFVTGDFTSNGLIDNVDGLTENEMLSIADWISFYEKDYEFVGLLEGTYYDNHGRPTERLEKVQEQLNRAKMWKEKQITETEVFPPCNSEWQKKVGGRVWCTNKSGGIKRDWVGVPRKLFSLNNKNFRCACVKNFGHSIATPGLKGNRGDLDNYNLREYDDCSSTSISCKLSAF